MQPDAQGQEEHREIPRRPFDRLLCLVDGCVPPYAGLQGDFGLARRYGRRRRKVRSQRKGRCGAVHRGGDRQAEGLPQPGRFDGAGVDQIPRAPGGRHALPRAREIPLV